MPRETFYGIDAMTTIMTLNAGSSSVKFAAYRSDAPALPGLSLLQRGQLSGVPDKPRLTAIDAAGQGLVDRGFLPTEVPDIAAAEHAVSQWMATHLGAMPDAIGHRIVHGGDAFHEPVRLDAGVLARLEALEPLAPLHQPYNLAPVRSLLQRHPDLPQVACFDTAFHHGHQPEIDLYALPQALIRAGVRRYGFHGLSYEYIASRLADLDPGLLRQRLVVAHLGNGASLCAMQHGHSMDTTMGFTALEGLVMGTRPGTLDPGIVLYLMQQRGLDVGAVSRLLYHDCGLKGLSGASGDMRDLLAMDSDDARQAIRVFVHRVVQGVAAMAASMGGIDGLVFTAGIGEHAGPVRSAIVRGLALFGAKIDDSANAVNAMDIAGPGSRMALRIIPTDEEHMIARHTVAVIESTGPHHAPAQRES